MLITKETQEKIDALPLPLRIVCNTLIDCLGNIITRQIECDVEEMARVAANLESNAKGKYSNNDLMNYDQACDMLGFARTNRVALKRELDKHEIKQVVINGHRVGFPRHKIEALLHKKK